MPSKLLILFGLFCQLSLLNRLARGGREAESLPNDSSLSYSIVRTNASHIEANAAERELYAIAEVVAEAQSKAVSGEVSADEPERRVITETITATSLTTATNASTVTTLTTNRSTPVTDSTSTAAQRCVSVSFDAKVSIRYFTSDGVWREVQLTGGNINGQLSHPNKCDDRQQLVVNYEQINGCQLSMWLKLNSTHVYADEIRFEYPIENLGNYPDISDDAQTCTAKDLDTIEEKKCIVAVNESSNYVIQYKLDDLIRCAKISSVTLKSANQNESIELQLTDFRLRVAAQALDGPLDDINNSSCPLELVPDSANDPNSVSTSQTMHLWLGITYALVGALFIFGVVFIYEKVIRRKFQYRSIRRRRHEK